MLRSVLLASTAIFSLNFSSSTFAQQNYSTGVGTDYPKRVFFGDLHLHSNISADAHSMVIMVMMMMMMMMMMMIVMMMVMTMTMTMMMM